MLFLTLIPWYNAVHPSPGPMTTRPLMTTKTNKANQDHASPSHRTVTTTVTLTEREMELLQATYPTITDPRVLVWRVMVEGAPKVFLVPKEEKAVEVEVLPFRFEDLAQA